MRYRSPGRATLLHLMLLHSNMKPMRESHYTLTDETGERVAMIIDRKIYKLELMNDDAIAECFNGGDALPLIANEKNSNS